MPIRILLVGAVVFMAAWFTVLAPKEEEIPASTPTAPVTPGAAQSAPGKFAEKAKAGAATAEADATGAANAGVEDGTTAPSATTTAPSQAGTVTEPNPAPAPPRLSPQALKGLPEPIQTALKDRKVVVLGVLNTSARPWAPMADDDRFVRDALHKVNRYGGTVTVDIAPLTRLASYDGLLKALQVTQSPTVVVVDRERRAIAVEGYVDRASIDQAVAEARRGSIKPRLTDGYLRKVNRLCARRNLRYTRYSLPTVPNGRRLALDRYVRLAMRYRGAFARIAAPKRWRGLKARHVRELAATERSARAFRAAALRTPNVALRRSPSRQIPPPSPALDRRFNAVGLTSCADERTRQ